MSGKFIGVEEEKQLHVTRWIDNYEAPDTQRDFFVRLGAHLRLSDAFSVHAHKHKSKPNSSRDIISLRYTHTIPIQRLKGYLSFCMSNSV